MTRAWYYPKLTAQTSGVVDLGAYVIRPFRADELQRYSELMCDPETRGAWVAAGPAHEHAEASRERFPLPAVAAVEHRAAGSLVRIVFVQGDIEGLNTDLSVFLVQEHQGLKLGRRILSALASLAVAQGAIPTVRTKLDDARAQRVAHACGFVQRADYAEESGEVKWELGQ